MSPGSPGGFSGRTIACPTCRGPSRYAADNPFRPFCCQRCRAADLGSWADERYRVGSNAPQDGVDDESAPPTDAPH